MAGQTKKTGPPLRGTSLFDVLSSFRRPKLDLHNFRHVEQPERVPGHPDAAADVHLQRSLRPNFSLGVEPFSESLGAGGQKPGGNQGQTHLPAVGVPGQQEIVAAALDLPGDAGLVGED